MSSDHDPSGSATPGGADHRRDALSGRGVIVTGGASGIGAATVTRLVDAGASVLAVDLDPSRLEAVSAATGAATMTLDLTEPGAAERVVAEGSASLGSIDGLCNVAGVLDRFMPVGEVTDEVWSHVFEVNVTAPMRLMRAVLPGMLARGTGTIVNVASIAGLAGGRAGAAYTASKHALVGLTRNTAAMYRRHGIRCVAVAPGGVATGIGAGGAPSAFGRSMLPSLDDAGIERATPDEIAAIIEFLLGDAASQISGDVIVADRGWTTI